MTDQELNVAVSIKLFDLKWWRSEDGTCWDLCAPGTMASCVAGRVYRPSPEPPSDVNTARITGGLSRYATDHNAAYTVTIKAIERWGWEEYARGLRYVVQVLETGETAACS